MPDAVSFDVSGVSVYGDHITVRIGSASGLHEIAVHETGSGTPLGAYTVTPSVPATTAVVPLSPVPHSTSLTITITALGSTPGALDTITFYLPRDTTVPTNIASNVCTGGGYRYGYNTQIKENEIAGIGNHYSALYWEYDPRVARRWNVDPKPTLSLSSLAAFGDNPIKNVDIKGDSIGINLFSPYLWFQKLFQTDNFALVANNHISTPKHDGIYAVYGHGNYNIVVSYKEGEYQKDLTSPEKFNDYMSSHIPEWASDMKSKKEITLLLYSCYTGKNEKSIAAAIANRYPNITVIAPNAKVHYKADEKNGHVKGLMDVGKDKNDKKGVYYKFKSGKIPEKLQSPKIELDREI